jgi:hypothetical protein
VQQSHRQGLNRAGSAYFNWIDNRVETMPDRKSQNGAQRRSMIALGVIVVLFVVGWILARELYSNGKIEDCMMSGRSNCVPLDPQAR